MSKVLSTRKVLYGVLLALALAAMSAPGALALSKSVPRVSTGGVKHVHGSSGQLDGVVNPNGVETSYFFEYGPTIAYGKSTKAEAAGKGTKGLKVGQSVTGILAGYHYRIVATYLDAKGPERVNGRDKSFSGGKSAKLRFEIPKGKEETEESTVAYGGTAEISGSLSGEGNTGHGLTLQATPYPYTGTFTTVFGPVLTNLSGHFLFRIADMKQNTEFRVLTTDRRPLYSSIITIHVTPKIIMHIRPAGGKGRYRIYGTVAPGRLRGVLAIQELKPQKAGSKREGPKAHTVDTAAIKKGNSKQARFSIVVTLSGSSSYRAYLKLPPKGNLESGHSNEVFVHAPKVSNSTKKGKKGKGKHTGKKHAGKKGKKK